MPSVIDVDVQLLTEVHKHRQQRHSLDRAERVATTEPTYRAERAARIDALLDKRLDLMGGAA